MDPDFWHDRWQRGQIGFHQPQVNGFLERHIGALGIKPGARIFLPLCGKTRDIGWLLAQGYRVAGAELSDIAIRDLFADLGVTPDTTPAGALKRHSAPGIDIFEGDIFALTPETLGPVDAVFDRAALVALPPAMRARYASHMATLTARAPQLLVTFDYDQSLTEGPPFSVSDDEVARLYGPTHTVTLLDEGPLSGGVRGIPARDIAWHLH
jgi:thiopurine S-methyltransferase